MDFAATALLHLIADDRLKSSNSKFDNALNELKKVIAAELDTLDEDHYNSLVDLTMSFKHFTRLKALVSEIENTAASSG